MKKFGFMVYVGLVLLIFSCSKPDVQTGDSGSKTDFKAEMRIANSMYADNPGTYALEEFKKIVERETGGNITVKIYSNSQLGGERETTEQTMQGSLEAAITTIGPLTTFSEWFSVLDIPFSFNSYSEAWMAFDSDTGLELLSKLNDINLEALVPLECGFRHATNTKRPLYAPEDFKGLKIRTMEAPMHMEMMRALGANPTPVPWTELYLALSQGIADGQENPLNNIWDVKMYENQDYLSLTGHIYDINLLVVNLEWFNSLPEDYRYIIKTAGYTILGYSRGLNLERESEYMKLLEEKGMKINDLTNEQRSELRKIAQPPVLAKIKEKVDPAFVDKWLKNLESIRSNIEIKQ